MPLLDRFELHFKPHLEILRASDKNVYFVRGEVRAEFVVEQATPAELALLDLLEEGRARSPKELLAALRGREPDVEGDEAALVETLEVLSDPQARSDTKRAEETMAAGEVHGEAEVRAALAARRR